ncbi:ABC transporter substrate-binding protein [Actinomadura graeca]|uniref:ABC transporter substrate-binding protein n=1 Tax=Actinomadura graeca TaxID=2750812 RepID=A0ABX8QX65_9ACTN|nr:ABC transporter substrate-binding protein [Actinomadura graeca]QXJ21353.1 ABC transporter substrate-binding protein [Actinomadura graeca]
MHTPTSTHPNLRRHLPLAAALSLCTAAALLSACGTPDDDAPGAKTGQGAVNLTVDKALQAKLPPDLRAKGSVDVAAVSDYPPLSFSGEGSTTIVGFNIDFLNAAGRLLGLTFNPKDTSFDSLIPSLQSGRVVLASGGATDTLEAEKATILVDYLKTGAQLSVKPGNPKKITSLDAACGQKVATLAGSVRYMTALQAATKKCQDSGKPPIQISTFKTADQGMLALTSGRVDAKFDSSIAAAYRIEVGQKIELAGPAYLQTHIGFQVAKGRMPLALALQDTFQKLIDNGTYKTLLDKWKIRGAVDRIEINATSKTASPTPTTSEG